MVWSTLKDLGVFTGVGRDNMTPGQFTLSNLVMNVCCFKYPGIERTM